MSTDIPFDTIAGYKITDEPSLIRELYGLTDEIAQIQEELYPDVIKGKTSAMRRLNKLCLQYPRIPHFKNYLQMAYAASGKKHKVREMTRWIVDEHPDYLFGKITLADQYLEDGMLEKIPEVLGPDLELRSLYPDREIFHFVEVLAYYRTVVNYFLACDEPEEAKARIEIMDRIDPDDEKTIDARKRLMRYNMEAARKKFEEDERIIRSVESRSYDTSVQTDRPPVFTHSEIEKLYNSSVDIDRQVLEEILALPRETLIRDLETVLHDSINRFEFFREKYEENGWVDEEQNFNLHALLLLGELKSESSLPVVLHLLRQGEELLDFWYGDVLTRVASFAIFRIGKEKPEMLKLFLKEHHNFLYARLSVSGAIKLIGIQYPERRKEVISIYRHLFQYVLDNLEDDRFIDTELISFWVWDCMDLNAKQLVGLIEELYRNQLVLRTICGTLDEVIQEINSGVNPGVPEPIENIYAVYKSLNAEEEADISSGLNEFFSSMSEEQRMDDFLLEKEAAIDKLPISGNFDPYKDDHVELTDDEPGIKVGRNDPCPCGSGKKFKKCCL